ncbi:aryl-sulfate sulfotransferase [Flavivirga jejuensis]|uniref:Aryl-sulfate sulfotransferase n=1 Tax=Flavivirga jejuensis TaxID=870487 RepID=A0ABT8WVS6_9FLAO|nr:aryl-sulfate sulfotransferase [Flavivirga jejuensis]MDO5976977.1 aryl-sulfate sulfotransferase [Flavivirga jejuensis]
MNKSIYSCIILTLVLFCFFACKKENKWEGECVNSHDIEKVSIAPVKNNVLKYNVLVKTGKALDVYVKYWVDKESSLDSINGKHFYYTQLSKNKKTHQITLTNLKQNTSYKYSVVVQDNTCKSYSEEKTFTTNSIPYWLPFNHPKSDSTVVKNLFKGYVLSHSLDIPGYLLLLDNEMKIVWYHEVPRSIKVAHWTKHHTFLTILSINPTKFTRGEEIAEFDLKGDILFRIQTGKKGLDKVIHHEVRYDNHDNIMALSYVEGKYDMTSLGGSAQENVIGDGIIIIDKKGNKVWEWSALDVLDPVSYPGIMDKKEDWLHANSLWQDKEGHFLISFRNLNQIWKIHGESGKLIWKLGGDDGDFNLPDNLKFYGQHAAHINSRGELMLLDNGLNDSIPKVKSFIIDEEKMTATPKINFAMPKEFYSASKGSAYLIDNKYVMFCSSDKKRVYYFDISGNYIGQLEASYKSYRTEYVDKMYKINDFIK